VAKQRTKVDLSKLASVSKQRENVKTPQKKLETLLPMDEAQLQCRMTAVSACGDCVLSVDEFRKVLRNFRTYSRWPVWMENKLRKWEALVKLGSFLRGIGKHRQMCSECSAQMRLRVGKFGPFWGCTKYPECAGIKKVNKLHVKRSGYVSPILLDEEGISKVSPIKTLKKVGHIRRKNARFAKLYQQHLE